MNPWPWSTSIGACLDMIVLDTCRAAEQLLLCIKPIVSCVCPHRSKSLDQNKTPLSSASIFTYHSKPKHVAFKFTPSEAVSAVIENIASSADVSTEPSVDMMSAEVSTEPSTDITKSEVSTEPSEVITHHVVDTSLLKCDHIVIDIPEFDLA